MIRAGKLLVAAVLTAASPATLACSTCACGDNTITLMGVEKPFGGRFRAAVDYNTRTEEKGTSGSLDRQVIDEQRINLGISYSFSPKLTAAAQLPFVRKHVRNANLGEIEAEGLGDMDVTLRWTAYSDGRAFPRHLGGVRAGIRLPTSDEVKDSSGALVDIDAQPDAGATAPNLGLWYGYYALPVFVSVSGYHLFYGDGRQGFDPGDATILSVTGQYAVTDSFAVQAGLDARHTDSNRFSGVEDPNSGGTLGMGSLGVVYRFGADFLVHAGVQLPLIEDLYGEQSEETAYRIGLAYDF
jgi:hypothetical protein